MDGPPLWVVERKGATVYLFGVRPIMGPGTWLTPRVEAALAESRAFWRETPPIEALAADPILAEHGFSADVELRDRLDDETERRVERIAVDAGLEPDTLQPFRPWFVLQALRAAVYTPIHDGPTMDDVLTDMAIAAGQTIGYEFADAESVVRFFSDLPDDVEVDLLRMELDSLEQGPAGIRDRYERGIAGDLSIEEAEAAHVRHAYPALYERLLTERNRAWAPRIDASLGAGVTTFISVGTMHLVGPDSIQSFLADDVRMVLA